MTLQSLHIFFFNIFSSSGVFCLQIRQTQLLSAVWYVQTREISRVTRFWKLKQLFFSAKKTSVVFIAWRCTKLFMFNHHRQLAQKSLTWKTTTWDSKFDSYSAKHKEIFNHYVFLSKPVIIRWMKFPFTSVHFQASIFYHFNLIL